MAPGPLLCLRALDIGHLGIWRLLSLCHCLLATTQVQHRQGQALHTGCSGTLRIHGAGLAEPPEETVSGRAGAEDRTGEATTLCKSGIAAN